VNRYTIKVFDECTNDNGDTEHRVFSVLASTLDDAIMLAFALDGGIGWKDYADKILEPGHLEMAKIYCEVIDGPLGVARPRA